MQTFKPCNLFNIMSTRNLIRMIKSSIKSVESECVRSRKNIRRWKHTILNPLFCNIIPSMKNTEELTTQRGTRPDPLSLQGLSFQMSSLKTMISHSLTIILLSVSHRPLDPPKVTFIHLDDHGPTSLTLSWTLSRRAPAHISHRYELMYRIKVRQGPCALLFLFSSVEVEALVWSSKIPSGKIAF